MPSAAETMTDESDSFLVLSVPLHSAELAKLRFLKFIMNARLPVWALGIVQIHLSLLHLVGQIVLDRALNRTVLQSCVCATK